MFANSPRVLCPGIKNRNFSLGAGAVTFGQVLHTAPLANSEHWDLDVAVCGGTFGENQHIHSPLCC